MTTEEHERRLAPCPFCGGVMQFRKALWPSDGNTDAVIHVGPSACGMIDFDTNTTDESVIAAWNRRTATAPQGDAGEERERVAAELIADHCAAAMALANRDRLLDTADAWVAADDEFNKLEMAFRDNLSAALTQREQAARAEERERCAAWHDERMNAAVMQQTTLRPVFPTDESRLRGRLDAVIEFHRACAAAIRNPGQVGKK